MPIYRFTDETPRTFPEYGEFAKDDTINAESNPDPNFFEELVIAPAAPAAPDTAVDAEEN